MLTAIDAVALTRELIRYRTISPPGAEEPCAEHLGRLLEGAGMQVHLHRFADGRANLVAKAGGNDAKPPLCFTGHLDTVPLGSAEWSVDPFGGEMASGRLYGRGASDMKSGVAAFVAAACDSAGHLEGTPGIVLVITAGEETGCQGASALARDGLHGTAGAVVVAEPSSNAPMAGHKGALWLTAITRGVTSHGSMPELGVNAAYKAARAIMKLERFDFGIEAHPALGKPTLNVGTVRGGMNINSVPDRVDIGVDIRTVPGVDHGTLARQLASHLGDEVEVQSFLDVPAIYTSPSHAWMRLVADVAAEVTGERAEPSTAKFFSDASILTPLYGGAPTTILGPGEPSMMHQTNEYCRIDRIGEAVEIYRRLIRNWCEI